MKKNQAFTALLCMFLMLMANPSFTQELFQLREEVNQYVDNKMPGLQTALLAEASKGDLRIAIAWPCVVKGEFIDDDIIGLVYKKTDEGWEFVKEIGAFRGDGKQKIAEAIGGQDFELTKPEGLKTIEAIPEYIFEHAKAIREHMEKQSDKEAAMHIEKLSAAFHIETCGYSDGLSELVVPGIFSQVPMQLEDVNEQQNTAPFTMGSITGVAHFKEVNGKWVLYQLSE